MLFAMGIDEIDEAVEDIVGRTLSRYRGLMDVEERIIIRGNGTEHIVDYLLIILLTVCVIMLFFHGIQFSSNIP